MNDASTATSHEPAMRGANPVLWLVIALPALAVVASFTSYYLAVTRGDKELPASYHWEGSALAGDDARLLEAARLGVNAALRIDPVGERCTLELSGAAPASLRLDLAHPSDPAGDRHVALQRASDGSNRYEAPCAALAPTHWWVQVGDAGGNWLLRGRAHGSLATPFALSSTGPAPTRSP
jgi:uncharacterized protein